MTASDIVRRRATYEPGVRPFPQRWFHERRSGVQSQLSETEAYGREIAFDTTVGPTGGREHQCHDRPLPMSVLIVDDDPTFLALASRVLACLGIEVAGTAADAGQALEIVHNARPSAVLVDVGLPDRNGIDLADELAELPWAPRVVLTSGYSEAWVAIERRPGRSRPPFIAKEEFDVEALRRILIEE